MILSVELLKLEELLELESVDLVLEGDGFLDVTVLASFPTDIRKVFVRVLVRLYFVFRIRCKCSVELTVRNLNSHALSLTVVYLNTYITIHTHIYTSVCRHTVGTACLELNPFKLTTHQRDFYVVALIVILIGND